MKIVILGYIVRGPLGGLVWHHLQYVLGLHLMGHEVLFFEDSEEYAACYDPLKFCLTKDPSYGLSFIREVFAEFYLENKWSYYDFHTDSWHGKPSDEVLTFLDEAEVLLNLSGVNPLRKWFRKIPNKVFIDTDPVFTQIKHIQNSEARICAAQHNVFLSYGENFGNKSCSIPKDGFIWKPTRQPVISELWKCFNANPTGNWTTVMQWSSYKPAILNDRKYGMKSMSFDPYLKLPDQRNEKFEIALGSDSSPKELLRKYGWIISDSLRITRTPSSYKEFLAGSKGEWSIAKHGYVCTQSGWFSERSAAYLASGKPVILQNTGFSDNIPTGEGVFAFNHPEDLPDIFTAINNDYDFHCRKARTICLEYFEYKKILNDILNQI